MKTQMKTFALSAVLAMTLGSASFTTLADTTTTTPEPKQYMHQFEGPTNPNAKGDYQLQSQQQIRNRINEQDAMQVRNQSRQMQNNAMQVRNQAQQMQNTAMQVRNQAMQMRNAQTSMQSQQKMQSQFRGAH